MIFRHQTSIYIPASYVWLPESMGSNVINPIVVFFNFWTTSCYNCFIGVWFIFFHRGSRFWLILLPWRLRGSLPTILIHGDVSWLQESRKRILFRARIVFAWACGMLYISREKMVTILPHTRTSTVLLWVCTNLRHTQLSKHWRYLAIFLEGNFHGYTHSQHKKYGDIKINGCH